MIGESFIHIGHDEHATGHAAKEITAKEGATAKYIYAGRIQHLTFTSGVIWSGVWFAPTLDGGALVISW